VNNSISLLCANITLKKILLSFVKLLLKVKATTHPRIELGHQSDVWVVEVWSPYRVPLDEDALPVLDEVRVVRRQVQLAAARQRRRRAQVPAAPATRTISFSYPYPTKCGR
jgi:hypothetical protein